MTVFKRAITTFPPDAQTSIHQGLDRWYLADDIGGIVVSNLKEREHLLPDPCMEGLLSAILSLHAEPTDSIAGGFQLECFNHVLEGGNVAADAAHPSPSFLGRAVERSKYTKWLFDSYGPLSAVPYFDDITDAEEFVARLLLGGPLNPSEAALAMSSFSTWVTWSPGSDDPFEFAVHGTADEVRACLGLDPKFDAGLILFEYESASLELFRPTVADAGLSPYFEPSPVDFPYHGWTRPWPAEFLLVRVSSLRRPDTYRPQRRPEALHRPITFGLVKLPVRNLE